MLGTDYKLSTGHRKFPVEYYLSPDGFKRDGKEVLYRTCQKIGQYISWQFPIIYMNLRVQSIIAVVAYCKQKNFRRHKFNVRKI